MASQSDKPERQARATRKKKNKSTPQSATCQKLTRQPDTKNHQANNKAQARC